MPSLAHINAMDTSQARELFSRCSKAGAYTQHLAAARPFATVGEIESASDQATLELDRAGLLEAFAGHPRIGDRKPVSAWSSAEQSGVTQADAQLLEQLRDANFSYEAKFDHVFLICATGKSAAYMVSECVRRISHSPEVELEEAREQLRLINRIRINKLLEEL